MAYQFPVTRAVQAIHAGRQRRGLEELQNIQKRQATIELEDIERQRKEDLDLESHISESPDMDPDLATFNFLKGRNPKRAMAFQKSITDQADSIGKYDPEAGVQFINNKLGLDLKYKGKEGDLTKIEDKAGGKVMLVNDQGKTVRTIDITPTKGDGTPTNLQKLMNEQETLINEKTNLIDSGVSPEDQKVKTLDKKIKAFENKITGTDIDIQDMTKDEIDTWGAWTNLTGKVPSVGRGKQATKVRIAILKSAARQALGADADGIPDEEGKTPVEAALDVVGTQADTKAIQGSLNFLDKQLSSMGSFVTNLNSQVDRVKELSEDLKTFDTRLLNVPLRAVRGKISGSPLQAKYDMFLSEIESEIGKLATGSTASIAELSATAQEKWSKIHDKNLSVKDMLELLDETRNAANLRLNSVSEQLSKTRERMRTGTRDLPTEEIEGLPPGSKLIGTSGGKNVYETPDGKKLVEE